MGNDFLCELKRYRRRMRVPAAIAAVTDANGVLAIEVVGTRSRAQPQSVATIDDQWHIGSCGKSITALLYACLVEAGLAEWRTPVRDLFPDVGSIDPGWTSPTVDDLLRCRAGVTPNPSPSEMRRLFKRTESVVDQRSEAAATVLRSTPKKPGEFRYSNLGYVIVGAAIDRLAGMAYEDAMQHRVWGPLGVTSAGLGPPPHVTGHRPRVRLGALTAGRGRPAPASDPKHADNPLLFNPAGRWHLTLPDWARVQRVFLQDPLTSVVPRVDRLLARRSTLGPWPIYVDGLGLRSGPGRDPRNARLEHDVGRNRRDGPPRSTQRTRGEQRWTHSGPHHLGQAGGQPASEVPAIVPWASPHIGNATQDRAPPRSAPTSGRSR